MGIINTNIVEDNFEKNNSSSYNLSILIGMDRFSYAIMDSEKQLLVLKSYLLNADLASSEPLQPALKEIFLEDKILKLPFNSTTVGLINNKSTLVPDKLYQADDTRVYLKNQVESLDNHQVFVDRVDEVAAKNIYAFDQEIFFLVKESLPNADFFHASTSVLRGILSNQNGDITKKIFINVKGDHLQIALVAGKELIFSNSFSFKNDKDFIYHVMLVFKQFDLNEEKTPVFLSGQITDESKLYRIIYRYINQIQFSEAPTAVNFGKNSKGIPPHFYFDLFSLDLCES